MPQRSFSGLPDYGESHCLFELSIVVCNKKCFLHANQLCVIAHVLVDQMDTFICV